MNWLDRNNPFDQDRYGYPSPAYNHAGYGYDSYAPQRSMDYDYGYGGAPSRYDQASSYTDRYEPDERYGEHRAYEEQRVYEEMPVTYTDGYDDYRYDRYEPEITESTGVYRNAYDFRRAVATTAVTKPGVAASEDVLVKIRGAMVHLVDDQESPLLAEGDFSVVRIEQEGKGVVAIVRVGDSLQWPLTKDEPAAKLDSSHYFFTLRVPRRVDDMDQETAGSSHESLTYGVTFTEQSESPELDAILHQYCGFSTPQLVHADDDEFDGAFGFGHGNGQIVPEHVVSSNGKLVTESSEAEFWRTMAPNVDDYNSKIAKTMAKGTGNIIKGIFGLRDSTLAQLENGSLYVRGRVKPSSKPSTISPRTLRNMKRVRNMSIATEGVAKSVLEGVAKVAGIFSGALLKSQAGKKFFQLLPGEVALVSMDAFGKVLEALEKAGTDVMQSTAMATQDVVAHRYGEDAGEVAGNTLSTAGHAAATAWTVSKLRGALNPARFRPSKTGMFKSAAKAVVSGGRSK